MNTLASFSQQELAAVLAGLRILQQQQQAGGIPATVRDISTDCGTLEALSLEQIDALCERINTTSDAPVVVVKCAGGAVQGTVTNIPAVDVLVLDYDVENDDHEFPAYPEHGQPLDSRDAACAWFESPLEDAAYTKQLRDIAETDMEARMKSEGQRAAAA